MMLEINSLNKEDYYYNTVPPTGLKLNDIIISYYAGTYWKIVPLRISVSYPLIHDIYEDTNNTYDITIIVCPVTLRSVVLKGYYSFEKYIDNRMILKNDKQDIMPIDLGFKITKDNMVIHNKRLSVLIRTFRSSLMYLPDAQYMHLKKKLRKLVSTILPISYYTNYQNKDDTPIKYDNYHPKTLVYIMQYINNDKIEIIIGKNARPDKITGYDTKKSGLDDYFEQNDETIIEQKGYYISSLLYTALEEYPQAKILVLNSSN